jgi:hypothetical protein
LRFGALPVPASADGGIEVVDAVDPEREDDATSRAAESVLPLRSRGWAMLASVLDGKM